jgi:HEXXH motif-containing protein
MGVSRVLDPLFGQIPTRRHELLPDCDYRPAFFERRVGLSLLPPRHREPEHSQGDIFDPRLDSASKLLREVAPWRYVEFPAFVTTVHPVTHTAVPHESLCSNSGNTTQEPPGIFLTVTHPAATAEAMVHEMAHHKLMRLGVTPDDGGPLLMSTSEQFYSAAVGRHRPIAAILHAAYSFLHMVEFDLALLEQQRFEEEARLLLVGNLEVATATMACLAEHARPHPTGEAFMSGLGRWAEVLLHTADAL